MRRSHAAPPRAYTALEHLQGPEEARALAWPAAATSWPRCALRSAHTGAKLPIKGGSIGEKNPPVQIGVFSQPATPQDRRT